MKRRNIAMLVSGFENYFTRNLCKGAMSAAKESDSNLVIFPGRYFNPPYFDKNILKYDYQFNTIFDYATRSKFDAVLIELNTIGMFLTVEQKKELLRLFDGTPVILITDHIEGYASVFYNNRIGLEEGVRHLIEEHHCKKIAFMTGTETNSDSIERLQVYKDVLEEYEMEFDPTLLAHGDFSEYSKEEVLRVLSIHPDIDGMVFANDSMAVGAYDAFAEKGLKVGKDVAVVSFDDAAIAVIAEPNLSTVRADPAGLGYKAVMSVESILRKEVTDVVVNSTFIKRQSCGCVKKDYSLLPITLEDIRNKEKRDDTMKMIYRYIFDKNDYQKGAVEIRELLEELIESAAESLDSEPEAYENATHRMAYVGMKLCRMKLEPFTKSSKILFLFELLYNLMKNENDDEHWRRVLSETCQLIFHNAALHSHKNVERMRSNLEMINFVTTTFTRDVLNYASSDDVMYTSMMETLMHMDFEGTYLFRFPTNLIVKEKDRAKLAGNVILKAYQRDREVFVPKKEEQNRPVDDLFLHLFSDRKKQVTAVATMLFSGVEQYGILAFEVDEENIAFVSTCMYQISAAIKTTELLKDKEENERLLRNSLRRTRQANTRLDEMSKSDELTKLLNRRGFLTAAREEIDKPENEGKTGVLIFADMNNLKIINDKFGHDDGDFALRMVGGILKRSVGKYDGIVSRFGGDEFCVFYIPNEKHSTEEAIREAVQRETEYMNAESDKEYYVSVSMGFCEFACNSSVVLEEVLEKADTQLYEEKKHKRQSILK
ncbi:MAG: GGDEF domain-containing protein [Lachnospiraceae bacterium]|nr:GGDEF domain-containing protein [Lachnospiraceae bacterium]